MYAPNFYTVKEAIWPLSWGKLSKYFQAVKNQHLHKTTSGYIQIQLGYKPIGILYAPRGVGKTFAALSVAVAVASGGEVFSWRAPMRQKKNCVKILAGQKTGICRGCQQAATYINEFPANSG